MDRSFERQEPGGRRNPQARKARASGALMGFHQIFPLGSTEGRAVAEVLFGEPIISGLSKDRYGAPLGWLHTWSTVVGRLPRDIVRLNWAMLAPRRAAHLEDAYRAVWRGKRDAELLEAGEKLIGDDAGDWQGLLTARLALPDLLQRWAT